MRLEASRREAIGIMASLFGTAAWAAGSATLTDPEFKKLAAAPKTADDHRALASRYRTIAGEHEKEAKAFETLAAQYQKGLPGVTEGHAHELARAVRHAAEHSRDFAEALNDVAEVHEGIAQGPLDLDK
jgi:hypothetical protein